MSEQNLLQGKRIRLTVLKKEDAGTIAAWHEDTGFLRLMDTNAAVPKGEDEISQEINHQSILQWSLPPGRHQRTGLRAHRTGAAFPAPAGAFHG